MHPTHEPDYEPDDLSPEERDEQDREQAMQDAYDDLTAEASYERMVRDGDFDNYQPDPNCPF